ncbi:nuclear transport factor 2 family protein, partial [Amycolatopsis sp. H6(2020)]|nr:nuclear transport factor 2 family protein [Amycolatopsis sp. H6(2020)]
MSTLAELARTYYDTVDTVPADVPPLFASDAVYKRPGYPAFE